MASQNVETFRAAHHAFNRRDFDGVVSKMAEDLTYRDQARNATFTRSGEAIPQAATRRDR